MGNHIYTTKKPYTFSDILQCSELCTALADELRQHYENSTSLTQRGEVEHCKTTNKSTLGSCPLERSCECDCVSHQLQAYKLSYNWTHNSTRVNTNTNVNVTHTLQQDNGKRTGAEGNVLNTVPKIASLMSESKMQSHYPWHEHEPSTFPSRIKCEPVQLSRNSILVKANEVYVLLHIQRKNNATFLPCNEQSAKPKATMTTVNAQAKQEEEEEEEHETCSPELPQPLPTRRQAEEDLPNSTFGRCSHEVIPAWAKKISLLFTPRGVMRPFASDIQKPRVKANTYNTSELLSALSLPSVSVECATTSCQNKANRLIQQKTEQEYVTQENDNMYSADYMYSIHILNGKRAHPLISAMAVLFANELEKLLRVPFVLVHLYNNSINTLVMLQREQQKVQGPTFEKSHVCNDLDNLNRRTHENTHNNQSMNVSALGNGISKGKIINVQNTSQLTNSVCNVINNESTLRTSNSAFPCSTNESSLISRDMASARSVSALTTSFPFQCSANNSSVEVEKNATLLESKLRPSTHKNSRASWFQLVPAGSIICEGDEYDNNNNKNSNVIYDNNKLECAHTGQANKTTTARTRTKNVNKKRQINTKSESCRNKFSTNAHLISQHHTEAVEHNPRHTQMVSEEEPHNTTGSFPYAENGTESSMPSSWEACSSLCNSTASLSEPQLPPPQLPSSSTLELQEEELNSKKEMLSNANESKTCLNSERQERAYAHEYAQNALLRILTNQYGQESQANTRKSDIICKKNNKHSNSNDDITNRDITSHTDAACLTSKVVNQSTNKSLQPEQMNSGANNAKFASSSAAVVAYNNNSSTLTESTEDVTSISLTSPRMIIHSTPRSMISKHARVSVKNSCNWPAGAYDKANSSCTLSNNHNNNSNSSKKNDTEIVGSSNLMNMRDTSIADKLKAGANSKVYNANGNVRNVQGPPTLHLYRGAKTSASSLPEVNKEEKEVQDTLHCEYTHKTTDQSRSTVTSQHSNSELPNCIRESNMNNTQKDNEAATHFTRESNQLHHMSMTDVTNDENGESRGEENKLREKSFTKAGRVLLHSDAEDIKKNASEEKPERQACTNNTENNEQVTVHENGDRKVSNEDQDEDDEVRMTDDRIRKWRFASVTATEILPYLFVGGELPAKNKHLLLHLGITTIVNTLSYEIANSFPSLFYYDNLYVSDSPDEPIFALFPHIVRVIEDEVENSENGKVYIHCHQGVSRSCTFVIAYLMWKNNWDYHTAYNFVRDRRNVCNPNAGFQLNLQLWRAHLQSVYLRCGFAFLPYSAEYPLPFAYQFAIIFDVPTMDEHKCNTTTTNNADETVDVYSTANMKNNITFSETATPNIDHHNAIASTLHDSKSVNDDNNINDNQTTSADHSEIDKNYYNSVTEPVINVHKNSTLDETVVLARPLIERNAQHVNSSHRSFTLDSEVCYGFVFKTPTSIHTFMYCSDSVHPSIKERAIEEWNYFVRFGLSPNSTPENCELSTVTTTTTSIITTTSTENGIINSEKELRLLINKELGWTETEISTETTSTKRPVKEENMDNFQCSKTQVHTEKISESAKTNLATKTDINNVYNNSVLSWQKGNNSNNKNDDESNIESNDKKVVSGDTININSNNGNGFKSYKNAIETLRKYLMEEKERLNNRDRQRRAREEFNTSSSMLTVNSTSANDTKDKLIAPNQNVLISAKDLNNKVVNDEYAYSEPAGVVTNGLQQSSNAAHQVNEISNNIETEAKNLEIGESLTQNAEQWENHIRTKVIGSKNSITDANLHGDINKNEEVFSSNMPSEESKVKYTNLNDTNKSDEIYQSDGLLPPEQQNSLYKTSRADNGVNVINEIQVFEYPFTLPPVQKLASINDLKSSKSYVIYLPAFGELLPNNARVYVWVGQCCNVSARKALQTFVKNCCVNHSTTSKDVYSVIARSINRLIKNTEDGKIKEDGVQGSSSCLEHTCTVQLPSGVVLHNVTVPVIREGEEPDDLLLLFD